MKKKYVRVGFTPAQKKELWERWRRGEQMKSIGREICKPSSSIFNHIRSTGGFTPIVRRRAPAVLSLAEREEISRGLVAAQSIRSIARLLKRAASTVSREVARNGGASRYRAVTADKRAYLGSEPQLYCDLGRTSLSLRVVGEAFRPQVLL